MYPQPELSQLAGHKAALRRRIGLRREECAVLFVGAMRPVAWLDRMMVLWRKIAPFAKLATIPLTLIFKRTFFPRVQILGTLLHWGPKVFGALRGLNER